MKTHILIPTLRNHIHLQIAQAGTFTEVCERVCLPNRTETQQTRHDSTTTERRGACNTGLAKVAIQCTADTFEVNQTLVLRINPDSYRDGENHHLRQARKR
jgi:hypothetical protein